MTPAHPRPVLRHLLGVPAPAKLNLFLHITGRRADGYHLLQSVFMLIDWCDRLDVELRTDGGISRQDLQPGLLPADDLTLRAARALQQATGCPLGAHITLDKHIPAEAGMGGGSSDAASVLLALNRLWGLGLPRTALSAIGLQLGADVPFFIGGHNAWVEGIGEQITPLELPRNVFDTPLVLLKPPAAIPTAAIFGSPRLKRDTGHAILADFLAAPMRFGRNDLQEPAQAWRDDTSNTAGDGRQVSQALGVMQNRFGNSRMTGSGSTVFSWVDQGEPPATEQVVQAFGADLHGGHWVGRVCRVLPCHPLLDLLGDACAKQP